MFHLILLGSTYSVAIVRPEDGFVELSSGSQTVSDGGKFLTETPIFPALMDTIFKDPPTVL